MFSGEKLFINILLILTAIFYWYTSSHIVPSIMGVIFMLMYSYDEKLYFTSYIFAIFTLILVIFFFILEYIDYTDGDDMTQFGAGALYMIVIGIKSKEIFDAY
ncbi:MAG: hypothetical protein QM497_03435 [Sulfurimonas sp.]